MTDDTNDRLWDALYQVMDRTGLDRRTIALKAIVPTDEVEAFLDDSTHELTDVHANKLAVFATRALEHPFGLGLAMVREASGLSLAEVEARAGISKYSVSKYERGERVPQVDALLALWTCYTEAIGGEFVPDLAILAGADLGKIRAWLDSVEEA